MSLKRVTAAIYVLIALVAPVHAATVFVPIFVPTELAVPAATKADYEQIHTVALISAVGSHVTLHNNHFVAPKEKQLEVPDWKLDEEVAARLRQYLAGRFQVKDVPVDRTALAVPDTYLEQLVDHLPGALNNLPKNAGVDAYIVVRPALAYGAPGLPGIALEHGNGLRDTLPVVWANYELDIVKADSGKVIARAYSRVRLRNNTPAGFSGVVTTNALKVDDDFKMTPNQTELLHSSISTLLNLSLIETLRVLDLGIELPPPGARTLLPIPPDKDPYEKFKTVAVVSALGSRILFDHMGGTVLSESADYVDKPDWQLDNMVEQRAKSELAKRFTVVDPVVDRSAFAAAHIADDDGKLAPSFPGLSPQDGIDLYVVFVKLNVRMAGVHFTKGIGVFNHTQIMHETTTAFAHYAVAVIDGHSLKPLLARAALTSPDHANADPQDELGNDDWPQSLPAITTAQSEHIHEKLVNIIDDSVDETLLRLMLLGVVPGDAPPPGLDQVVNSQP